MAAEVSEAEMTEHIPKTHIYDGLRLSVFMSPTALNALKNVKFYSDDLVVISYPKSGTTWVQEMAWLVRHDANIEEAYEKPLKDRMPFLEAHHHKQEPEVLRMPQKPPRLMKTHLPARFLEKNLINGNTKAIIVMRNLKDTLVSFFHQHRNNSSILYEGTWDMFFEMFKKGQLRYGDWGEFYKGWQKYKNNPNFLFLQYEAMKLDPHQAVRMVAKHCNKVFTEEQVDTIVQHTSFEKMKANSKMEQPLVRNFYRKGVVGDWVNYFSADQISYIDQYEKELNCHG